MPDRIVFPNAVGMQAMSPVLAATGQCPLWVKSGHSSTVRPMSALRHKRTFAARGFKSLPPQTKTAPEGAVSVSFPIMLRAFGFAAAHNDNTHKARAENRQSNRFRHVRYRNGVKERKARIVTEIETQRSAPGRRISVKRHQGEWTVGGTREADELRGAEKGGKGAGNTAVGIEGEADIVLFTRDSGKVLRNP